MGLLVFEFTVQEKEMYLEDGRLRVEARVFLRRGVQLEEGADRRKKKDKSQCGLSRLEKSVCLWGCAQRARECWRAGTTPGGDREPGRGGGERECGSARV